MKFPKPWTMQQTGPDSFIVTDAEDHKLFYIVGDEGDGSEEGDENYCPHSALFYSDDPADTDFLINEIAELLGCLS